MFRAARTDCRPLAPRNPHKVRARNQCCCIGRTCTTSTTAHILALQSMVRRRGMKHVHVGFVMLSCLCRSLHIHFRKKTWFHARTMIACQGGCATANSCPPFLRTCFTACAHVPSCNVKADAHATCSTLMRGDAPWGRFPQRATSAQRQGPVHRWTILLIQQKSISCQEKSVTMGCYERCAAVASAGCDSSLPRLGSCSFRDSLCFFHNLLPST